MTDLQKWRDILKKQKGQWADWTCDPDDDYPKQAHCLSFGCPDGQGAYLQVIFDKKGKALEVKIINPGGVTCDCKWCTSKTGY